MFCPCSFVYSSVKCTDNFWKVCGLIDGFFKSHRHIASGVEKMADESMSDIKFCTTTKGYLPHYSYIFRNKEPLGTEMKNVACYRLGAMLHPYTQKGKKAMKTSNFQKYPGGTAACMERLMMATKGCIQLKSN